MSSSRNRGSSEPRSAASARALVPLIRRFSHLETAPSRARAGSRPTFGVSFPYAEGKAVSDRFARLVWRYAALAAGAALIVSPLLALSHFAIDDGAESLDAAPVSAWQSQAAISPDACGRAAPEGLAA